MSQFAEAKQLRALGSLPAAKQLMATTQDQFTAWSKDWAAFQKANGIQPTVASTPPKEAGR
jgi:hypothetical protein